MAECPFSTARVDNLNAIRALLRSDKVVESPKVSADNYKVQTALGDINVREYLDGILTFSGGDTHRQRRRVLNALVRPDQLIRFREDIILPSVDRWLGRAVVADDQVQYGCDLAVVADRIFLEFAAKIIGLEGVESEEGMARLQSCVFPMFSGMSASHFEDREAVTAAGIAAKAVFVDEFYQPSLEHIRSELARVGKGEIKDEDVPLSLLHIVATGQSEDYDDEALAIREAVLLFVATTGTSTQSILSTVEYLSEWFGKHPEDIPLLDDMEFISNALQETLRIKGAFLNYLSRLAADDIEVEGCAIKGGDEIHLWIPRASKDPAIFGPDAAEFNPKRTIPQGYARYGLAFGTGKHQCLGLRAVLGNDGKSGSHLRLVQHLFKLGVKPDPRQKPEILEMRTFEAEPDDLPTYVRYPVIFTNWTPPENAPP